MKTSKEEMMQQLEEMGVYAQSMTDDEERNPTTPPHLKNAEEEKIEQNARKGPLHCKEFCC